MLYRLSYTGNNALACRPQPNHDIRARNVLAGWRLGHPENLELLRFYIPELPGIGIEEMMIMMMWRDIRIIKDPTRFNRDLPEKTMIDQYFERIVDGRSRHRPSFGIQLLVNLFCRDLLLTLKHQVGDLYAMKSRSDPNRAQHFATVPSRSRFTVRTDHNKIIFRRNSCGLLRRAGGNLFEFLRQ